MMSPVLFVLALSQPTLPGQLQISTESGPVIIVTHTPLPVIINGKGTTPHPQPLSPAGRGEKDAQPLFPAGSGEKDIQPSSPGQQPGEQPAAPAEPLVENIISFNPELLDLNWSEGSWLLVSDGRVIRDFGRNEAAARQVLFLVRQLRVNQYGWVGQERPVLEYWLSDGQAPLGFPSGLRLSPLDQQSLRLEKIYGQWCLRDAYRTLFCFGTNEADAQKALAIVRKYRFTQLGAVGSSNPPIVLLLARPGDNLELLPHPEPQPQSRDDLPAALPTLQSLGNPSIRRTQQPGMPLVPLPSPSGALPPRPAGIPPHPEL